MSVDDTPAMGRMNACRRLLAAFALVALLGAEPGTASAGSLGGVVSDRLSADSLPVPAAPPVLLLADNFTTAGAVDGRLPEHVNLAGTPWVQARGKWAVRNGYLDPPMAPQSMVTHPAGTANVTVEVAATITSAFDFGVVLWSDPAGTTYLVAHIAGANAAATNAVSLDAVAGNSTTTLATATVASALPSFVLSVTAVGNPITVRRNGVTLLSPLLSPLTMQTFAGLTSVGLWVSSSGNEILDDVRAFTST